MTYQNDANANCRNDISDDTSYIHWIIGGVIAFAIVIAAVAFISTGNAPDQPQITATVPIPAPSPPSLAPANR